MIFPTFAQNDDDTVTPPEPVEPVEIITEQELELIIEEALQEAREAIEEAEDELIEAEANREISKKELEIAQRELREAAEELEALDIDMEAFEIDLAEVAEMERVFVIEMEEMSEELAREMAEMTEDMLAMNMDLTGCMTDFKTHRKFQYDLVRELARDGFIAPQDKEVTIEFKNDKVKVNGELIEDEVLRKKYLDMRNDYGDSKGTLKFSIDLGDC